MYLRFRNTFTYLFVNGTYICIHTAAMRAEIAVIDSSTVSTSTLLTQHNRPVGFRVAFLSDVITPLGQTMVVSDRRAGDI